MKKSVNKLVWKVSESWEEGCQLNNNPNPDHYPDDVDHDDDIELVDDVDDDDDDDEGLPAHSHHDKTPPWWEFVSNE